MSLKIKHFYGARRLRMNGVVWVKGRLVPLKEFEKLRQETLRQKQIGEKEKTPP